MESINSVLVGFAVGLGNLLRNIDTMFSGMRFTMFDGNLVGFLSGNLGTHLLGRMAAFGFRNLSRNFLADSVGNRNTFGNFNVSRNLNRVFITLMVTLGLHIATSFSFSLVVSSLGVNRVRNIDFLADLI